MLLDAAMVLVRAEGLDGLTMPGLARAADVAVGGLYRYFESKETLILALQVRAAETFVEFLEGRLAGPPLGRVRSIATSWPAFADEDPEAWALLDASLSDPRELLPEAGARAVADTLAPAFQATREALAAAAEAGDLAAGDAHLRARVVWGAVHGVLHLRKLDRLDPEEAGVEEALREVVEALLRGWR